MKNLTTYLMFWVFRIIVAVCFNLGINFIVTPMDLNFEVILLFLTFISLILVVKRSVLGGIIYLIGNGLYFGASIFNAISQTQGTSDYMNIFISFIGIVLPLLVLFDLLLDKNRKAHPVDKKTDWFYKNKDYDRKFDERADRNEYKF